MCIINPSDNPLVFVNCPKSKKGFPSATGEAGGAVVVGSFAASGVVGRGGVGLAASGVALMVLELEVSVVVAAGGCPTWILVTTSEEEDKVVVGTASVDDDEVVTGAASTGTEISVVRVAGVVTVTIVVGAIIVVGI
jgi:hypothetical protein